MANKNGKLIAVRRPNKHGHMVTKWVLPETAQNSSGASKIGAPTVAPQVKEEKPRFQSEVIAEHDDPRVQNGQVFDRVVIEGRIFARAREGVEPGEFSAMRVQLNRPLRDGDADKIASIVGYSFRTTLRSQYGSVEIEKKDSPYSVVLDAHTGYSRSSNVPRAVENFHEEIRDRLMEGTPKRTTDRAGPGTKDTRLVNGFSTDEHHESDLEFELYYDVTDDVAMRIAAERETTDVEILDTVLGHDVKPLSEGML